MKTLKHLSLFILTIYFLYGSIYNQTFAQPAPENQAFAKLDFNYNPPQVLGTWDRNEPNLIFWSNSDLNIGISLNHFISWGLPTELQNHYDEIDAQTTACMNDWDSYMCIDQYNCFNMGYNLAGNSVNLDFSTNPELFTNVHSTLGTTKFAVIEEDGYKFKHYHLWSLTGFQQTEIYFNNCNDFDYTWSIATEYINDYTIPLKPIVLHELGHILGLGHNNWSEARGNLVMYSYFVNEPDKILTYLTVWDKVGVDAYWIFQGYMQNPISSLKKNYLSNSDQVFFMYEPEFLLY